jgi:CHAT domain-containing protein/tetratricopeptide (TPR) repeat protein
MGGVIAAAVIASLAAQSPASKPGDELKAFAMSLLTAPSDEARTALLAAQPALKTPALIEQAYDLIDANRSLPVPQALVLHRFLRGLAVEVHDADHAALSLIAIGVDQGRMSNYDEALQAFETARAEAEDAKLPKRIAQALVDMGIVHARRGDLDLARECDAAAEALYDRSGDRDGQASIAVNRANVDLTLGNYREALELNLKALKIREELHSPAAEIALVLTNIGVVYDRQHDTARAVEYYERSVRISEAEHAIPNLLSAYNNLGSKYLVLGRYADAERVLNQALALAAPDANRLIEGAVLYNLARLRHAQKKNDEALALLRRSLTLREQFDPPHVLETHEAMSEAFLSAHRLDEARDEAMRAVALARASGNPTAIWGVENQLARVESARQDRGAAKAAFRRSIAAVEDTRRRIAGDAEQQQVAFAAMLDPYEELMGLLVEDGEAQAAFSAAEQAKARALLEFMQNGAANVTQALTASERERERSLRQRVYLLSQQFAAARSRLGPDAAARTADLSSRLETARLAQDDFTASMYAAHPGLQARRGDVPLVTSSSLGDIPGGPSTASIEFQVTGAHVFAFVARRLAPGAEPRLSVTSIAIEHDYLEKQVSEFRAKLGARDLDVKAPARALYDTLLAPVAKQIAGATALVIAPDGPLWDLPFQALVAPDGRYLIEQSAITLVPSFSALRAMTRANKTAPAAGRQVALVFGSSGASSGAATAPPLTAQDGAGLSVLAEAEAQARAIGRVYGTTRARVVLGAEATSRQFRDDAGQYAIVHVAAHGVLDDLNPLHSYLVLGRKASEPADAAILEAYSLMQLPLRADLVVLSACETGRGRVGDGEGLIGMSWALFAAGAPSAVVSQWKVDAASSTALMTTFHQLINAQLTKTGRVGGRSAALRQAALTMLHGGSYSHPFYWAPFVLIGDGS